MQLNLQKTIPQKPLITQATLNAIVNILKIYSFSWLYFFIFMSNAHAEDAAPLSANRRNFIMENSLHSMLEIKKTDIAVETTVRLENTGKHSIYFWSVNAPKDGKASKTLFEITCNNQKLKYIGMMAKRGAPTPEEFIEIKPGEVYSFSIDLKKSYRFPDARGHCAIRYSVLNPLMDGVGFFKIESNTVVVNI